MSNVCTVGLIKESESSVAKRYFEGRLENDRQSLANFEQNYRVWKMTDHFLWKKTTIYTDVVRCLLGLP